MPIVSIVMPVYNCSEYIFRALSSVIEQTFEDWEMLIVDDCSTDNSLIIVQRYAEQDSRIKVLQLEENSGAAVARNTAIETAQGRFIAFLDSDDCWLPNKLEAQLKFMQEKNVAFSYTAYEKLNEKGEVMGQVGVPEKVSYRDLLKVCSIGCLTAMYDAKELGKIYMPLIRKRQDLGLWLKILKLTPYAYGITEVLAQYQLRADSISANKRSAAQHTWRLYRDIERLSLPVASYYFFHYAVNGILRTKLPRLARMLGVLQ